MIVHYMSLGPNIEGHMFFRFILVKQNIILLLKTTTFRAIIIGMYHHLMFFYHMCSYYGHMTTIDHYLHMIVLGKHKKTSHLKSQYIKP